MGAVTIHARAMYMMARIADHVSSLREGRCSLRGHSVTVQEMGEDDEDGLVITDPAPQGRQCIDNKNQCE